MSERKLATIRRISDLIPIEGADKIELAVVDGWKVIVKKGEHAINELVVYLEIDSWVPNSIAPFLTKSGHYPKVYHEVEGQRLKTVKMKGVQSQGLILPFSVLNVIENGNTYESLAEEGADVTELLGILKWEKEIPACLAGTMKGGFPSLIPKTNQERIQNLTKRLPEFAEHEWEVTEKLHGSSATYYIDPDGEFHVCSRNVNLKFDENNVYWQIAIKYNIRHYLEIMRNNDFDYNGIFTGFAIQGEIVGPGINGNQYGLSEPDFYIFDLFNTDEGYCKAENRQEIASLMHMNHVPVLHKELGSISGFTVDELLKIAEGKSVINGSEREGLVFKSKTNPDISFKVVSNVWLSNGGEDQ